MECDIGKLLELHTDMHQLSRENKYHIVTLEPNPDASSYPRTRPCESSAFRQFQPSWLKQYTWLHYSCRVDGAYCRTCVLFAPDQAGGQDIGQFVTKPYTAWIKMSQKAATHAKDYHLISMTKMGEFIAQYENPALAISTIVNSSTQQFMENNQKVVESLLKIVLLCGKQGLALRGHRDDRIIWSDISDEHSNEGNFVELVRFRAETDPILAQHLINSPRNARYTSKTIQNELVEVIGNSVRNGIVDEVKKGKILLSDC